MKFNQVYFVYLGNRLPYYARSSFQMAQKYSGLDVHLIGNNSQKNQIKDLGIHFTAIEDFYNSERFNQSSNSISSPKDYRDGFWLKTLERLFVVEQFMKTAKVDEFFHSELDQILFRADVLIDNLNKTGKKGVFLPFHSGHVAVASILFCNEKEGIESFIDFTKTSRQFPNEMELLAAWVKSNPNLGFRIPTIQDLVEPNLELIKNNSIGLHQADGISDGMQTGMWVAGIDPRNVPIYEKPKTKFVDPPEPMIATREQFSKVKFSFDEFDGFLNVQFETGKPVHIYNLHIHSKIHNLLNKFGVSKLLKLANSEVPASIFSVRYQQIKFSIDRNFILSLFNPMKIYKYLSQPKQLRQNH